MEAANEGERLPHATNPGDGVRTYFEDSGGEGPPVLFYTGFADPLEVAKSSRLARALIGEFRLIFADHRGQGGSDKPYDPSAYALPTRVDSVAVLDVLGIERAHFLGSSWGARLGFALGEHAPGSVLTLVLCGNQPYAWDLGSPTAQAVGDARRAAAEIPGARFVSLAGHSHISALYEADDLLLPHILELLGHRQQLRSLRAAMERPAVRVAG